MTINSNTIVALSSALIILVYLSYALIGWTKRKSTRILLQGIGAGLMALGLWIGGVARLLYNGIYSLIYWCELASPLSLAKWVALGLTAVGLAAFLASRAFPRTDHAAAKELPTSVRPKIKKTLLANQSSRPSSSTSASATPTEDDEIEQILRSRGIN